MPKQLVTDFVAYCIAMFGDDREPTREGRMVFFPMPYVADCIKSAVNSDRLNAEGRRIAASLKFA